VRIAARRGDAAHNLARCYETGSGLPADAGKAREWYGRATSLGYPKSSCALGNLMITGVGGPRDIAGGLALCKRAAETGNPDAQTDLGNYLITGTVVPKDAVQARKWYTLAANQNQANAAFVLAQIYWNGDGIAVDRDAAERWWKVAYDGGRKDAAGFISRAVFKRMLIMRDGKEAIDRSVLPDYATWLQRAAAEDPDPTKRKVFAESLAVLKGEKK
jgi:TPR repeat protein